MGWEMTYISLPITGSDIEERKEYARQIGNAMPGEVVNPLKNGVPLDAPYEEHIRKDIENLLRCDSIVMCEGWEQSRGCRLEWHIATMLGLKIFYR